MRKAIAYIDGQNIYHDLKSLGIDGYYFHYSNFIKALIKDREFRTIKYYGARYPSEVDQGKHNRDDAFFKNLENEQKIKVILGRFKTSKVNDQLIPREKGVDVRLTTDFIFDAFYSNFDDAYIFSSDTDLVPAIESVKKQFPQVKIFNVCVKPLVEFKEHCHGTLQIYENKAKKFKTNGALTPTNETLADLKNKFKK